MAWIAAFSANRNIRAWAFAGDKLISLAAVAAGALAAVAVLELSNRR